MFLIVFSSPPLDPSQQKGDEGEKRTRKEVGVVAQDQVEVGAVVGIVEEEVAVVIETVAREIERDHYMSNRQL